MPTSRLPTSMPQRRSLFPRSLLSSLSSLAILALAAGCAAPGPGDKQPAEEEAVYITGSHMARRGKVAAAKTMSKEQLEEVQRLNDMPGAK